MSVEKVRRYVVDTYSGCLVEDVNDKVHNKGYRYIKVDDAAGLVEALHRAAQSAGFQYMTYETRNIIDNELARWQS